MTGKYNNEKQAIIDLKQLRGTDDIQADLGLIREELRRTTQNEHEILSISQVLVSSRYRWSMLITIILQLAQALSGINALIFYLSKMFAKTGIPSQYIPYANIGIGFINVISTIVALFLIEKVGRRVLIIYPMFIMVVLFAALTIFVKINES